MTGFEWALTIFFIAQSVGMLWFAWWVTRTHRVEQFWNIRRKGRE